jgi:hypothetical protein
MDLVGRLLVGTRNSLPILYAASEFDVTSLELEWAN